MIRKLLIANRGEIACRIIQTCRRLGIRTVAAYSDADRGALHVELADEALRVGASDAASSYLNAENIADAALRAEADAIHPGYGFLSERLVLPRLCAERGILWVGPSADAIERMGSKIEAKRIAQDAGVACVPGYAGDAQDDATLQAAAREIGFPVLIKASAGGGGRGMRCVDRAGDLSEALRVARAEAQAGFGDGRLLLEKFIRRPRHLEVQLAGDKLGNLVHLFERECSIQRNYQKVVEEAPAPRLEPATREALLDAALRVGRAVRYDSVGTVEFILDAEVGEPWFLEMNTRLQVEHPVTELITGVDLVELQIRAADGERLPLKQSAITCKGSAIEVRLNAEDPAADYRPQLGMVTSVSAPAMEGVRIDSGIRAGSVVTPHYDSLLAKIIGYGPDRATAARRLSGALREFVLLGLATNQAFLSDLIDHPQFRAGDLSTRFIAEAFPDGWQGSETDPEFGVIAAVAAWAESFERREPPAALGPWIQLGGFRVLETVGRGGRIPVHIETAGGIVECSATGGNGRYAVTRGESVRTVQVQRTGRHLILTEDGRVRRYTVSIDGDVVALAREGRFESYRVTAAIARAGHAATGKTGGSGTRVVASIPGIVSSIEVHVGQVVEKGANVVVLEAMKLMHRLAAPVSGTISGVFSKAGDSVAAGTVLVEIEPAPQA